MTANEEITNTFASPETLAAANRIYLRRRNRVLLPEIAAPENAEIAAEIVPVEWVASVAKNVESLGYGLSWGLVDALRRFTKSQLAEFYAGLIETLRALRGADKTFKPFYPNFPKEVMSASAAELYLNALLHYWTDGEFRPDSEKTPRKPLNELSKLTRIDIGNRADFLGLFPKLASSNLAFSEQDQGDCGWFIATLGDEIRSLLPETVPQKENVAALWGLFLKHLPRASAIELAERFVKTATDVLRVAVSLSGGDVSLAKPSKFRTLSWPERVFLLALLERAPNRTEDMLRRVPRFIRLGEKLHPGEFANRFPETFASFDTIRNDKPFPTFASDVGQAMRYGSVPVALDRLATRPGEFARRLDWLIRRFPGESEAIVDTFSAVANRVATPILVQVREHFSRRAKREKSGLRVFFPKGNVGKSVAIDDTRAEIETELAERIAGVCASALLARFATLPALGRVYIDPMLENYKVPLGNRSASKALRTIPRGSRVSLPASDTLRFFLWWKNGGGRTDIDLSAAIYDSEFNYIDVVSYYNLKTFGGVHSGDIVDAPKGASEFIDISIAKVREKKGRYVVMSLNSYTQQPFAALPECFAGWMSRKRPGSGEVYEPSTVLDRFDLSANTKIAIPIVFDLASREAIWCDIGLTRNPLWVNNVDANVRGISATLRAFVDLPRASLYDLFELHGKARGTVVETLADADTIFSVDAGTPFQLAEIGAQYLAD